MAQGRSNHISQNSGSASRIERKRDFSYKINKTITWNEVAATFAQVRRSGGTSRHSPWTLAATAKIG